jgi:hypothetical protein
MITDDRCLTDTDHGLLAGLLAGKSLTESAAEIGVAASTAYRRHRRPAFRVALAEGRAGKFAPSAEALRREVGPAIDRLARIRDDPAANPSIVLRACENILNLALKYHEAVDVLPRLAAIEARMDEMESGSGE